MKKLGIALGGGGAKGIAHLAFLDKLDKNDIKVSCVSGTSIGAIVGALYCSGLSAAEIMDFIKNLDEKTSTGKKRRLLIMLKTISPAKREAMIKKFLEHILPVKTFEELKIPLKICAVDFHTMEEKMFDSGNLVDAVLASMALPSISMPYKIGDRYYIDGGCLNVMPCDYINEACDVMIAIDVSSLNKAYHLNEPNQKNAHIAYEMASKKACFDNKIENCNVDLLYRLVFDKMSTLDFFKYEQAYEIGVKYSDDLIDRLNKVL